MPDVSEVPNTPKSQQISADSDPEVLPRNFDRYLLLKRIARGGMGEVFLATPSGTIEGAERPCVLKVIRKEHIEDSSFLARFLDEARIQAQLEHPGVVRVLEAALDTAGKPFCVFEHVEGRNLSEVRLRAQQLGITIPWPDAVAIAMALCDGLSHVHERTDANGQPLDIVHRDLSPQNVMLAYGGDVKLIDFGTARGQNRRCHTIAGIVFAKPGYVAPEVANNNPGGIPADIYAIGIMLWEMLSGRRFLTGEPSEHLAAVAAGIRPPTPVADLVHAPPELDVVLQRMTAVNIEERYRSAFEAMQDFVQLLKRAPNTNDGQRSVRVRISQLMHRLYPAEPTRTRAEFMRLVACAKQTLAPASSMVPPPSPEPPLADAPSDPQLLKGTRYRLLGELGKGSSGLVYEALHLDLGRRVALKLLSPEAAKNSEGFELFRREARTVAQLEHENIVTVYDFGKTEDGRAFLAMEMLRGDALDKTLLSTGALEWRSAVSLTIQACRALEAAHAARIVHRDIKPANLFVTRNGLVKLLDFGIAHLKQQADPREQDSEAFVVVGTPEYMAPEQATGAVPTASSDVYALGSVLYEMLTGEQPFAANNIAALIDAKRSEAFVPVRKRVKGSQIPRSIDRVLAQVLSADPEHRYASAETLRLALDNALDSSAATTQRRSRRVTRLATQITVLSLLTAGALWVSPELRHKSLAYCASAMNRTHLSATLPQLKKSAESVRRYSENALAKLSQHRMPSSTASTQLAEATQPSEPSVATPETLRVTEHSVDLQPGPTPAFELTPKTPASDLERAISWLEHGQASRALHTLRRLGNESPQDATILSVWQQAAEQTKAWGEARSVAEQRARAEHSEDSLLSLARLQRMTGQSERARVTLQRLIREFPDCGEAQTQLDRLDNKSRVASR
jgi:serine/threonine-protein kinase